MTREFEISKEVEVDGTPEQVWDAIATGPGIDSWFMGPHTVDGRLGGRMTLDMGFFQESSTITAWEPGKHLAYSSAKGEDGTFHAMEYLIEGRDQGTTVLRFVHSGILADGWGDEFVDQQSHGWNMYLFTLGQYVKHFPGQRGTYVFAQAPEEQPEDAWPRLAAALGVPAEFQVGDEVTLRPLGVEGVVDYGLPGVMLGVRGPEGLYRFHGTNAVGHHVFGDATGQAERWQAFLAQTLGGQTS
ncbi:SRPBCC domain-containing protein [Lentzea sp. HUAS12]|uniref:SRPBCC family protein n=1 Tax=Lentzea sp. HUAS12 TaxID=2951806 RepID=UPI00209D5B95|nr:SRPBCC domain-containing protein [Lentzea sp. HUAS12]USX49757.1 SRPBCC domain-containing protein [Lentzea sp. HUAS12]